ncbi:nuclear protein hcc-1 [Moniliophthora roreri MCA 2997]|uniref:Nuclear protein hcc-1 n=2 Tax=Moniliophthora roreri TaxID=221103 RepID=V2XLE3_MONRO|nr:nuclear protein hcc-1 [Moniliophthora roreri MCA 2997]
MQHLLRPLSRSIPLIRTRNFVSTVLLNRPLEQLTLADLRKEARSRGLSSTGNKATLVGRIREHEKSLSSSAVTAQATPVEATPEGVAPGIPPEATPAAPYNFHIIIPDATYHEPEPAVQIPYVPDLWTSSTKAEEPEAVKGEEQLPKLLVIAGVETHQGGGPSHNLLDTTISEAAPSEEAMPSNKPGQGGLFDDMAEDLGLPHVEEMKKSLWKLLS